MGKNGNDRCDLKSDRCVNVDNSVDFVDFLEKDIPGNDNQFKLST